ncbi:hypothetical protein [Sphingobium sp. AP50]|uniref:hypothetical protein n=1 Tax=Sphingobium sp. AP50 TaxID=1884369 RepID=UPI000B82EDB8|nr:hypothetical protein [Sphingobium sp. AP50]
MNQESANTLIFIWLSIVGVGFASALWLLVSAFRTGVARSHLFDDGADRSISPRAFNVVVVQLIFGAVFAGLIFIASLGMLK